MICSPKLKNMINILLEDVLKQTKCENYKQEKSECETRVTVNLRKKRRKEVNGSHSLIVV